jgi:histidinol-phosphatase (PHP family)
MEDFVKEAIAQGFTHLGFSPHSPVPFYSPCNMSQDNVPSYINEVERLRTMYGDKINLYASMEIDYLDKAWGPSHEYFQDLPLDYRIGSVHFIPSQSGEMIDIDGSHENFNLKMERYFASDIRYVVETFYKQSIEMVNDGGFDLIGHFDKIGNNASHYCPGIEDEPWYQVLVSELIDAIIAKKLTIEINTKAWDKHNRFFPHTRYWKRLIDAQAPIIINSDAHYPHLINANREEAFSQLQRFIF